MVAPGATFDTPWYDGLAVSPDVPGTFPVSLGGRPYLLDLTEYSRATIPARRQPVDDGQEVGDQSLNTEGLWSRSASDWSLGAGQDYFDGPRSQRSRFRRSIGVDPWTRDQLTLLPATERKLASANTNLKMVATGARLYVLDGQTVRYTTDPTVASPTWTAVTGTPAATALDLATDGFTVWVAFGASDLFAIAGGGSTAAALGATDTDAVGYVNGRLLAGHDNVVSEVDSAGTYTAEFTHPLTAWTVRGFAASPSHGYFFGDSGGGETAIYRIGAQENGTLAAAVFSGSLPTGETLNEMRHYAGVMLLATTVGLRVAQIAADGSLGIGPAVEVDGGSEALTASGQFTWFGWSSPHGESSAGLGRADLAELTDDGTPPYASDVLAVGETAAVTGAATFGGRRYFAVSGDGVWGPKSDLELVASGWLESGRIRWGTLETKVGVEAMVGHDPLAGTVALAVASEDSPTQTSIGASTEAGSTRSNDPWQMSEKAGEWLENRVTLSRSAVDDTTGPVLRRVTLRALPAPRRVREIVAPLIIRSAVETRQGVPAGMVVLDEFAFLEGLEQTGRLVTYQEGARSHVVYVDQIDLSWRRALVLDWGDGPAGALAIEGVARVRLVTTPTQ